MRKRLKIMLFIVVVVLLTACGCQVDLSHKHYLDNYGVCNSCKKDQSILLTKNADGEYVSDDLQLGTYNETFIRFVADGEQGITVTVECETSEIRSVTLLSKDSAYMRGGTSTLTWENELVSGKTYYLRLKITKAGITRVRITPIVSTDCE